MKKRYEFNMEDIQSVSLSTTESDQYTMNFVRKYDENGNDTQKFITTYSAIPETSTTDKSKMSCVCKRCGNWQSYDKEKVLSKDFKFECVKCEEGYEDLASEESVMNEIYAYMDEDVFFESEVVINGTLIK